VACGAFLGYLLFSYPEMGIAEGTITAAEGEYITYFAYAVWIVTALFLLVIFALR
jgi:hypothetical protein